MKTKMKVKMGVDLSMTLLLLCLMAYQVTGQLLHEVFGTIMLALFIAHHILNLQWYGRLFKGRYSAQRAASTVINFALLASVLALGYSGIVMSGHVFAFLRITGGKATARTMHLAASYWAFVLMSVHLGLHWGMVTGMVRRARRGRENRALTWGARALAAMIACYGFYCFLKANIFSYMFLQTEFVFFDYEKSAAAVFLEHIAMMGFWVFVGYYASKCVDKITAGRRAQGKERP